MFIRFSVALLAALVASTAGAADSPSVPWKKLTDPPKIDGTIDATEWSAAARFEGMQSDFDGSAAEERTEFWLGSDDKYVYFAARMYDSQPSAIRAIETRINASIAGDEDSIDLSLDVFGTLREFNSFETNPLGATDLDLAGGRAAKREWTGEFLAKSRVTSEGWEAEMRIPWQLMRLPGQGTRDLRFQIRRQLPRLGKDYVYRYVPNGRPLATPTWAGVELPKPDLNRQVLLLPYVYLGHDPDEDDVILNSGLDARTQLTDRITLVGSINPDFRNVENQVLNLDFSRFARIAGESRPFFQEGSDYVGTALLNSRVIDRFDVGVNVHGNLSDRVQFGVLNTTLLGKQNAFAGTATYAPDERRSYRVAVTSLEESGRSNRAYLLRATRQVGKMSAVLRTMGSEDTDTGFGSDHEIDVSYSDTGFFTSMEYQYRSPDYNPGLGFAPERDFHGPELVVNHNRELASGPARSYEIGIFADKRWRTNNDAYREGIGTWSNISLRNGLSLFGNANASTFEDEKDTTYSLGLSYPNNNPGRSFGISREFGRIAGETYSNTSISGSYRDRRLSMNLSFQRVDLQETREQTIFGVNYDLMGDRSIGGRLVTSQGDTNWYLSLRRSGNRGIEYYLIVGDPNARTFRGSVILKVAAPFEL